METKRLKYMTISELEKLPRQEWLIKDVISTRSISLLQGRSKSFLSYAAVDIARHIGVGLEWHGHHIKEKKPVWYFIRNQGQDVQRYNYTWKRRHPEVTKEMDDNRNVTYISAYSPNPCLHDLTQEGLVKQVIDMQGWDIPKPALIVFDSLADFSPYDFLTSSLADTLVQTFETLIESYNCGILLTKSSGSFEDESYSGHEYLFNAVDTVFKCKQKDRSLICEKQREAPQTPTVFI